LIPDPVAAALARLEAKLDAQARYVHCLHRWLTAGVYAERGDLRRELDDAARALAPPGRVPVVSDPDAGPPAPMS
jgi:hypothetical protein